ncbi:transporter substrate-binding domain-containing protein [Sulfurospirillum sp.]|nr:transporter substrate-binding domain-containing protein [Sulfurospirillum sp.]
MNEFVKLPNFKYERQFYSAIVKNDKKLEKLVLEGIKNISQKDIIKIEKKWIYDDALKYYETQQQSNEKEKNNLSVFTLEELDYIKNSPPLKFALEDWKPIIFSENGELMGIAGEVIAKAIEHSGLKFEYVTGSWTKLLNDFKEGRVDILPTTAYTKDRVEYGLFSDYYLNLNNFLYVKRSNKDIKSLKDLYKKRLAIINDYAVAELIKEKFPNIKIINTVNLEESIKKVLNGKAEALIATQIVVQDKIKELMITNLKEISQSDIKPLNLHVYSKNGDVVLKSIMNKLLKRVTREEKNRIILKWINASQEKKANIVFSEIEKKYIKEHSIIKFSEINWKPLSIIDKNNFSGIFSDYMKIVEKKTGLRFKYVPSKNWKDVLDKFKSKEINFIPSVNNLSKKDNLGLMSEEYINFDFAIVSRKEGNYIRNIKNLRGKVLAIPENYSSYNMIKSNYPDIEIIATKDIKEALTLVSQKKAYAFIGHAPVVIYNIKNHFPELKVIGLSEEKFHHHFLIQRTYPELLSIINKVISSITIEEKEEINNKWIKGEINTAIDYSIVYKIVFSFIVILTIILVFTKKLSDAKNEIEISNRKLENLLDSLKETQKKLIEAEKMASLGGLVAGVAHEINTPIGIGLTGITHFLHITEEIKNKYKLNNISQEEFEDYLADSFTLAAQINTNLKRTAELVKSFKQISIDQTHEEIREFNVKDYMNEILLSMNNILKKTNLKIELICKNSLTIKSYAGAFSQIITNLIINSIKHGYLKRENGNITIEISKKDNYFMLVYKDDGKGISKDNLTKIFDPFFTTNRKGGGTGLGLNIIYNIVTSKLEGSITCNSKENMGVEFIIKFKEKEGTVTNSVSIR